MGELAQLPAGSAAASPFPKNFSKGDRTASSLVKDLSVWPVLAIVRGGLLASELGDIARCWHEHRGSPVSALSFHRDNLKTEWISASGSFNLLWQRRAAAGHGHGRLVRVGEISCRQRYENFSGHLRATVATVTGPCHTLAVRGHAIDTVDIGISHFNGSRGARREARRARHRQCGLLQRHRAARKFLG